MRGRVNTNGRPSLHDEPSPLLVAVLEDARKRRARRALVGLVEAVAALLLVLVYICSEAM